MLTRRQFIAAGAAVAAAGATSCSSGGSGNAREASDTAEDFSARFARLQVADEPNGDLSKVVWPEFVTDAAPEVQRLYEFQITNGEVTRYMPCFCGCGQKLGIGTTVTVTCSG